MRNCSLLIAAVLACLFIVACALPNSPETVAKQQALTTAKTTADTNATAANAQMQYLQSQINDLRNANSTDTSKIAALNAQIEQARSVRDQSVAQSNEAQKAITDLNAKTQANADKLDSVIGGVNQGAAGASAIAPFTGPAAPYVYGFAAVLTAVGTLLGNWRGTSTSTTAAAKGAAAVASSDAMIATGATPAQIIVHDAMLASTLDHPAAIAVWNATPDSVSKSKATTPGIPTLP